MSMKPYPADKPPCGDGYYGTSGGGYVKTNGEWYGGYVWSGYHWLED